MSMNCAPDAGRSGPDSGTALPFDRYTLQTKVRVVFPAQRSERTRWRSRRLTFPYHQEALTNVARPLARNEVKVEICADRDDGDQHRGQREGSRSAGDPGWRSSGLPECANGPVDVGGHFQAPDGAGARYAVTASYPAGPEAKEPNETIRSSRRRHGIVRAGLRRDVGRRARTSR